MNAASTQRIKVRADRVVTGPPAQTWAWLNCGDGTHRKRLYNWAAIDIRPLRQLFGDLVTVDPPKGGIPTTTITDARGQTTDVRQYKADSPTGDYDATKYTYTPADKLKTVTDGAGNVWTHSYDLRGREYQTDDPDKGTARTTFNDLDQITSTEDAGARNSSTSMTRSAARPKNTPTPKPARY